MSIARGEQQYFDPDGVPTATEGCKSNALMRCCKDLGIASELWDPRFIRGFMREAGKETSLNVLDAEREVFSARINQISAEFDARIASYLLARRTGMLTPAALGLAGK